jgi:phosphoribosylamine--glycine ligase
VSKMKVLIIGSGGREHALGWTLARSDSVEVVDAAPGNPGMAGLGTLHPLKVDDLDGITTLVQEKAYDLVVIGPENPLALGLADRLRDMGTAVFGPGASGARLESSKAFAKDFMKRHGIPTAGFDVVGSRAEGEAVLEAWGAPLVVKASGLAAGKGVIMAETLGEARQALADCFEAKAFGDAGSTVVLEKKLEGEEASIFVITDGHRFHVLPGSQDHKRALDGDEGPNTGGMGAYSPAPVLTPAVQSTVGATIIEPTLGGLRADGIDFRGLLYVGLMMTENGPEVLEYNVRFGDPETQAVLPRVGFDLGAVLLEAARGELSADPLPEPKEGASACVVAATADYPRSGAKGLPITGVADAEARGALVFHAGTQFRDGELVTAGGRVLGVVGMGETLRDAVEQAYAGIENIQFEGIRYRHDIAHRALGNPAGSPR